MSDVFVAQGLLRDAFPLRRYGKLDNVFYEACKFVQRLVHKDFTQRRARSIWEGTARRIDAEVDLSTAEDRGQLNFFINECEGMCGV